MSTRRPHFRSRPGLIIPDLHYPYHDKAAWALAMRVGRFVECEWIAMLGDGFDFYTVSRHDKSPARVGRLVDELRGYGRIFADLEALRATEKHYCFGNHENRLHKYIDVEARALHGLKGLTAHEVLELDSRGWTWSPYGKRHTMGRQSLKHDFGRCGHGALKKALEVVDGDVWQGHTHIMGEHVGVSRKTGETIRAMSFGWLGSIADIDYCDQDSAAHAWSLGCGVGWTQPDGTIRSEAVRFIDGKAKVEGQRV